MDGIDELCDAVRETAFALHVYLGPGHFEHVYENALLHRLRKRGMWVESQVPLKVFDEDGTLIGNYIADLLVERRLILELKASRRLTAEHIAQVLGYLKASRQEHALLINFGAHVFEIRKYRSPASS